MNSLKKARHFRTVTRGIYFCMVTAPAVLLFVILACISFNKSISGTFLEGARQTVENTPSGKVRVCDTSTEPKKALAGPPEIARPSAIHAEGNTCKSKLIDERIWQKESDSMIRSWYMLAVFISFGVWIAFHINEREVSSVIRSWLKKGAN